MAGHRNAQAQHLEQEPATCMFVLSFAQFACQSETELGSCEISAHAATKQHAEFFHLTSAAPPADTRNRNNSITRWCLVSFRVGSGRGEAGARRRVPLTSTRPKSQLTDKINLGASCGRVGV